MAPKERTYSPGPVAGSAASVGASAHGLAEETPEAYKDVNAVVEAAQAGGLGRKVARLVPLGVVQRLTKARQCRVQGGMSHVDGHRA